MTPTLLLIIAMFGWILSLHAATAARSLHALAVHELEDMCRLRNRMNWFRSIVEHRDRLTLGAEAMRALATTLTIVSTTTALDLLQDEMAGDWKPMLAALLVNALAILAANIWIPHAVSEHSGVNFLYYSWKTWWVISVMVWPVILLSESVSGVFRRATGAVDEIEDEEEQLEDEIRSIVSEGERDGLLESDERDMIEGVMELDEKDVCSVMTPRSQIDALDIDSNWSEAVRFVVASGRTRVPVFSQRIDQIEGILLTKDLLRESLLPEKNRKPLRKLLRRVLSVPESTMLDEMLQQFLHQRTHMAIVKDEYAGTAGLVTIEDVLEEIVGEIVDETDDEQPVEITLLGPGKIRVDGNVRIDMINDRLGTELPEEEDFDTIAGLIMSELRRVPAPGKEIMVKNARLKVVAARPRSIDKVQIEIDEDAASPVS